MQNDIKNLISNLFKNSKGEPYKMTDGQCDIFMALTDPFYKWVWISAPTRYGKTETIALAAIILAVNFHLKVPIVAGSMEKANKIMEYIISHLSDHEILYRHLINAQEVKQVDRLKVRMSKEALRWRNGGWIYITSVDSRNVKSEGESVVGEGGDVVCRS